MYMSVGLSDGRAFQKGASYAHAEIGWILVQNWNLHRKCTSLGHIGCDVANVVVPEAFQPIRHRTGSKLQSIASQYTACRVLDIVRSNISL